MLIGRTIEETLIERDTVIFPLQQLGSVMNLKKPILTPTRRIKFLGVIVDSLTMTLSLLEKKVSKVQKQCLELLQRTQASILESAKLIGLLSLIIQAVLQINFRYLQQQQIQELRIQGSYCKKAILNRNSEEELQQRIQNSKICNGHCLIQSQNLVKMGGTENQMLLKISKEIWQYLLKQQIKITSEYLPCSLNVEADWQSRNSNDPSEWKLCPKIFKQVCQRSGIPKSRFFCLTNYPSTLLGNSTLLVRWQMP